MKTTAKLSFMMFVEWFIWGAWFVPLWLWLSKSGFSAGEIGWSLCLYRHCGDPVANSGWLHH
ncbi:major facilitator superfamily protein [Escherichia coli]|uniref:Major facilitator superfamily protein n=1 Tax=Escherichia coli TaxID=562 RepID=A0A376KT78_ECOLX|nr:major facilitator superfamily protein [Escherichia coli]